MQTKMPVFFFTGVWKVPSIQCFTHTHVTKLYKKLLLVKYTLCLTTFGLHVYDSFESYK